MSVKIHIIDAFTQEKDKGNRAGVVLDADGLTEARMQDIAAFAGYSETAFVLPANDDSHDLHVRYFTPTKEVPICGHATIATHFLRAEILGLEDCTVTAKTGVGILPVDIEGSNENRKIIMTQSQPEFGPYYKEEQKKKIVQGLGISYDEIRSDLPVQIVSTGHSKVMIPIKSVETLDSLTPNMDALNTISQELGCSGYFVFVIDESQEPLATYGRMFAPAIGIPEDPVTGNANGPAGAYLAHHNILKFDQSISYLGHQGIAIGKPGTVEVRLEKTDGNLSKVQVAGHAVEAGILEYNA